MTLSKQSIWLNTHLEPAFENACGFSSWRVTDELKSTIFFREKDFYEGSYDSRDWCNNSKISAEYFVTEYRKKFKYLDDLIDAIIKSRRFLLTLKLLVKVNVGTILCRLANLRLRKPMFLERRILHTILFGGFVFCVGRNTINARLNS